MEAAVTHEPSLNDEKGFMVLYCTASPLQVLSALVTIAGQVSFIANDGVGIDGGAIFATSFGQLRLLSGGSLNFTDNRGV